MSPKRKCLIALLLCLTATWGCETHVEKAEKYVKEGKIADAIEEYKLALQDKEGKEGANICIGIADLYLSEDTTQAVQWCQKAIRRDPEDPTPYIRLGEVFSSKDEVDSALWYYSKAQELTTDEAERKKIGSLIEELDFRKAKGIGTFQVYIEFGRKHPDSKYKEQAGDLAWDIVKSKPTLKRLHQFIEVFPKSKHISEAKRVVKVFKEKERKKRIVKKINDIYKDDKAGELPLPEGTDRKVPGGKVEINTENDTQYELTVYYAGPETLSVSFQASQTKTVKLSGGTYRVAAEVDNPTVIPFKGTHAYKKGWHYTSRFYITHEIIKY